MSLCFAFSGYLAAYLRDKKAVSAKMMSWVKIIFYFAGVLRAIYAVLWYSSHSFGTCSSFIWMEERNFHLREGTENKADTVEAVLQAVGSLGFGILCLECHGKAAGISDPKPNRGNLWTIKREIKHTTCPDCNQNTEKC